jgi:hypothetical protein
MINVNEVIDFIEKDQNIKLLDYQKDMVKAIISGDRIYTPRCAGRSVLYKGYANYLTKVEANKNNYGEFDYYVNYETVVKNGLMSKGFIERSKNELGEDAFNREFVGYRVK